MFARANPPDCVLQPVMRVSKKSDAVSGKRQKGSQAFFFFFKVSQLDKASTDTTTLVIMLVLA